MVSPPHGYRLTPDLHALLRGAPPPAALRWVEAAVAPGLPTGSGPFVVRRTRALRGGTSSAIHAVDVEGPNGTVHRLVLRRFVRADWLEEEPDVAAREALALRTVTAAPAPRLVAVDPTGEAAGDPAVLMTRLPGRVDWDPADLEMFLRRLAEPLPAIHAIAPDRRIPDYEPYGLELGGPPRWSRRPEVWLRAIEVFGGPPPVADRRLIHRDYHPGNVLWRRGRVTAVVDWPNTSVGVPEADVGHCRWNLAGRFGQAVADRFLALYQAISGRPDYHPYWDIVAALGGNEEAVLDLADEDFLAAALQRL